MNLNNFKPTWKYFKVVNQMNPIDTSEILNLIEDAESVEYQSFRDKLLPNSVLFSLLILFCQSC